MKIPYQCEQSILNYFLAVLKEAIENLSAQGALSGAVENTAFLFLPAKRVFASLFLGNCFYLLLSVDDCARHSANKRTMAIHPYILNIPLFPVLYPYLYITITAPQMFFASMHNLQVMKLTTLVPMAIHSDKIQRTPERGRFRHLKM